MLTFFCENWGKPFNFWGTGSLGKWSQHRTCLSSGVFGALSQAHSHGNFGLTSCSFSDHQPCSLGAGRLKQIWTAGMPEQVMAQKTKSKHFMSHIKCSSVERRWLGLSSLELTEEQSTPSTKSPEIPPYFKGSGTASRCDATGSSGLAGLGMPRTFVSMNSALNERTPQKIPDSYRFS